METDSLIGRNHRNNNNDIVIRGKWIFKCIYFVLFALMISILGYSIYWMNGITDDYDEYTKDRVQCYAEYEKVEVMKVKEGNRMRFLGIGMIKIVIPSYVENNTRHLEFYNTNRKSDGYLTKDDFTFGDSTKLLEDKDRKNLYKLATYNEYNQNKYTNWFKSTFDSKDTKLEECFIDPNDYTNYAFNVYRDGDVDIIIRSKYQGMEFIITMVCIFVVAVETVLVFFLGFVRYFILYRIRN